MGAIEDELRLMGYGYTLEEARAKIAERDRLAQEPPRQETERQRQKREARDRRALERYWSRQAREDSKRDHRAYARGQEAGDRVGLDRQVGRAETRRIE